MSRDAMSRIFLREWENEVKQTGTWWWKPASIGNARITTQIP
jgi:hypothetical protein